MKKVPVFMMLFVTLSLLSIEGRSGETCYSAVSCIEDSMSVCRQCGPSSCKQSGMFGYYENGMEIVHCEGDPEQ